MADGSGQSMGDGNPFWGYWYFHVPNYVLAMVMYLMAGRLALSPFLPAESRNYIWRSFVRLTDPVVRLVAIVTPAGVPLLVLLVFGLLWAFLIRVALFVGLAAVGLAPGAQQAVTPGVSQPPIEAAPAPDAATPR